MVSCQIFDDTGRRCLGGAESSTSKRELILDDRNEFNAEKLVAVMDDGESVLPMRYTGVAADPGFRFA